MLPHEWKIALTATPSVIHGAPLLLCGDLAAACRVAAEYGCQGVEIHLRRAEDVDLNALKRLLSDFELEVPTLGTGLAAADGLSLASPQPAVRSQTVERIRGHIELAAEIGSAVTIGILSGKLGRGSSYEIAQRRSDALGSLRQVCEIANALCVTVLLEPLNRYECDYINTLADAMHIANEVALPNVRVLADTFHMNIEEVNPSKSLLETGPMLGHFHFADSNRQVPGRGHLDSDSILDALCRLDYQGYISFEILPVPDPVTAIREAVGSLRAVTDGFTRTD